MADVDIQSCKVGIKRHLQVHVELKLRRNNLHEDSLQKPDGPASSAVRHTLQFNDRDEMPLHNSCMHMCARARAGPYV